MIEVFGETKRKPSWCLNGQYCVEWLEKTLTLADCGTCPFIQPKGVLKCAWCNSVKEVFAWKEHYTKLDEREDRPICKQCHDFLEGLEEE